MSDAGYFVGQVAGLLGSGKKNKKSEQPSLSENKLAELFNVKQNTNETKTKNKKPKKKVQKSAANEIDSKLVQKSKKKQKSPKDSKQGKTVSLKLQIEETGENKVITETHKDEKGAGKKSKKQRKKNRSENGNKGVDGNDTKPVVGNEGTSEKTNSTKGFCPPKGIIHESLVQSSEKKEQKSGKKRKRDEDSDDENEDTKQKRRKKHKRDKTKDKRTVFVGNIPIDCKKTAVKTLFAEFGRIESVRYRCPPVADPKVPKKVTMIKKDFHPERSNIVSFVCFKDKEAAEKALKLNGHNLNGFHLRVDLACNEKKHNKTNSVFVGNLPYDIEENTVWEHFEPCGTIENIRIVRDRKTGLGKGFGYVLFQDKSSVDLALKLNCSKLNKREIRVDKCVDSQQMKTPKNHPARQRLIKKAKKLGMKPTNMRPGETRKPRTFKKKDKKTKTKDSIDKAFSTPKPISSSKKHIKFD